MDGHIAFFESINPITDTECALRFRFGLDMYISSWMNASALEKAWDIPGTTSAVPEFVRRVYSPSDGGMNIMPRKRTKVDGVEAPYEVIIRLATQDMETLIADDEGLRSWAENIID